MYQTFLTFIKKNELIHPNDSLLLAVSGGVDSMVMANLFHQAGYNFGVAHVNYKLRGDDSENDQKLVEDWCNEHQVTIHIHEVNPAEYEVGESIQMVARRIRYDFFESLIGKYSLVATAHNANDNVETVLLNLTKGTGIHGLEGIAMKRDRLIRPILYASREEIYAFAKEQGIKWREDKSNQKSDYQRNLIRNQVIPLLKSVNSNLEHTFDATIQRMIGAAQILDERVEQLSERFETQGDIVSLDLDWFDHEPKSIVLLSNLIKNYGFNYSNAQDLAGAILRKESGKIFYAEDYVINLDRNTILISPRKDQKEFELLLDERMGEHRLGNLIFNLQLESGNNFQTGFRQDIGYFDRDKISFPLKVRTWQQGDVFRPLGMKGKKKVSDFMIDSKIPLTLKKEVLVLESQGEIVWLIGHRIDDRFKVTASTTHMLKIELNHHA